MQAKATQQDEKRKTIKIKRKQYEEERTLEETWIYRR